MLTLYRRHLKSCAHRNEGRGYRRCKCPIWVDGFLGREEIRRTMRMRDWEKAQSLVREWEATGKEVIQEESPVLTVAEAWARYLKECKVRGLRDETIKKYAVLSRQMEAFAAQRGIRALSNFDLDAVREFRASWSNKNLSALKKLENLRTFFKFANDSGWISGNPARKLRNPKIKETQTLPFEQDEMISILAKCDGAHRARLRALVLLLRYSGLRIGDATTLARSRIKDGNLFLYTSKAGTPVRCPLPDFVVSALDAIPVRGAYFFWTGESTVKTVANRWSRQLGKVFTEAGIENGHAHRFRDTFAVSLLLAGKPIEHVATLLGHRSIRITEKHYSPWVKARQEQLEADVRDSWKRDAVALLQTKGTSEVHEKGHRPN